jgi:hypothetical protein
MYRELVERSYEKVASLKLQLASVVNQSVNLRDKVAIACYSVHLDEANSTEEAAMDSYRAADALLRVRESGTTFESDILDILKRMRDTSRDDVAFGRTVRSFLKDK